MIDLEMKMKKKESLKKTLLYILCTVRKIKKIDGMRFECVASLVVDKLKSSFFFKIIL